MSGIKSGQALRTDGTIANQSDGVDNNGVQSVKDTSSSRIILDKGAKTIAASGNSTITLSNNVLDIREVMVGIQVGGGISKKVDFISRSNDVWIQNEEIIPVTTDNIARGKVELVGDQDIQVIIRNQATTQQTINYIIVGLK